MRVRVRASSRLSEAVAGLQEVAVALEDAARVGKMREVLCGGEVARLFLRQNIALAGETDRRGHHLCQGQPAVGLLRVDEPCDRAGNADGLVARGGKSRDDVALRVEIHSGGGRGGGALAVVEEVRLARLHADEHESAAAEVARLGIDDGEREIRPRPPHPPHFRPPSELQRQRRMHRGGC